MKTLRITCLTACLAAIILASLSFIEDYEVPAPATDIEPLYGSGQTGTEPPQAAVDPPLDSGATEGGADPFNEFAGYVVDKAIAAQVITLVQETTPDGTTTYGAEVTDPEALQAILTESVEELSGTPGQVPEGGLSLEALWFAKALDRVLNHGIYDPEAACDMTPPRVIPGSPRPDRVVRSLRLTIAMVIVDEWPSGGLDPASLSVCLDGRPLDVTLSEDGRSVDQEVPFLVYQGHHTLSVSIADKLGQTTNVEWPFTVALNLEWLPSVESSDSPAWVIHQTIPVRFALRDDDGVFGVDPGVVVHVVNPLDSTGGHRATFKVGHGRDSLRIFTEDEEYFLNLSLRRLGWARPGMTLQIRVEARGLLLGETEIVVGSGA